MVQTLINNNASVHSTDRASRPAAASRRASSTTPLASQHAGRQGPVWKEMGLPGPGWVRQMLWRGGVFLPKGPPVLPFLFGER